jgi:NADPH:quinone reductase-like Zn-dependent oxidoreductase
MTTIENRTMRAIRQHAPGGPGALRLDRLDIPRPAAGEVLVRVHAAAITRDELDWRLDRLPVIPSYELSGVVAEDAEGLTAGDEIFGLTAFDRDGVAADYAAVPAALLAPKPRSLGHVEAAALPLAGLSAWQGLFVRGRLAAGERVLIHGAAGGVGHLAVQLAREHGAHVIATASAGSVEQVRALGADEVVEHPRERFEDVGAVDLVFDTAGGDRLARSPAVLRPGGRLVTVAHEPPEGVEAVYFIVEPDHGQLVALSRLADEGSVRPLIDEVFPLDDARRAFERSLGREGRGKVVLTV